MKINETQLRKIIKESIEQVLKENEIDTPKRWWTVWVTVQSPSDRSSSLESEVLDNG
jgi:hypothetical protein